MTKRLLFLLTLLTVLLPLQAQEVHEVDSIYHIIESMPRGRERLAKLAELVRLTQQMAQGINYSRQLYTEAVQQQNDTMIVTATTYISSNHYSFSDNKTGLDSIRHWAAIGLPLAKKHQIWRYYFELKKILVNAYIFMDSFEYGLEEARDMANEAERIGNETGLSQAYLCMGMAYQGSKRWKEVREMYLKAYDISSKGNDPYLNLSVLLQLIDYLYFTNHFPELLIYTQKVRALVDQFIKANPYYATALSNTLMLIETYDITSYARMGELDKAKERLPLAHKYHQMMTVNTYDKYYFEALCDYYLATKQYNQAISYGDSVQKVIEENGLQTDDLIFHLQRQGDLYYAMGNYGKALPLYRQSKQLRDSINQVISDRQMVEIKEMFAMDRLELEEAKAKQRVRWAVVGIALLIILLIYLLWRRSYHLNKELRMHTECTARAVRTTQRASEQKRRFLATMSHAIRVPLHSVVGFSQLLSTDDTLTDEERLEYGEIVRFNTEQLMFLVNSVLDLSRLEANMTKWQIVEYDLVQLIRDAAGSVKMNTPQVCVDLDLQCDSWPIYADTGRLMQVFTSLMAGTVTTPHPELETVKATLLSDGQTLMLKVEGSPLADANRENQESALRHSINRLTVEYFHGSYEVDFHRQLITVIFKKRQTRS